MNLGASDENDDGGSDFADNDDNDDNNRVDQFVKHCVKVCPFLP